VITTTSTIHVEAILFTKSKKTTKIPQNRVKMMILTQNMALKESLVSNYIFIIKYEWGKTPKVLKK
jgi:hypothetical protein